MNFGNCEVFVLHVLYIDFGIVMRVFYCIRNKFLDNGSSHIRVNKGCVLFDIIGERDIFFDRHERKNMDVFLGQITQ